jgi:hypothetical protein
MCSMGYSLCPALRPFQIDRSIDTHASSSKCQIDRAPVNRLVDAVSAGSLSEADAAEAGAAAADAFEAAGGADELFGSSDEESGDEKIDVAAKDAVNGDVVGQNEVRLTPVLWQSLCRPVLAIGQFICYIYVDLNKNSPHLRHSGLVENMIWGMAPRPARCSSLLPHCLIMRVLFKYVLI